MIVKTLKKIDDKKEQSDFLKEQSIMSELMHPNIVRFYGITNDGKQNIHHKLSAVSFAIFNIVDIPSIVLEFLPNGDLQTFLKVILLQHTCIVATVMVEVPILI